MWRAKTIAKGVAILALAIVISFAIAVYVFGQEATVGDLLPESEGGLGGRLLAFGISAGASALMGAVKKRTFKKQYARNAIPVTNSAVTAGAAGIITSDPWSMLAAVGGSLAMSGVYSLQKRIRTGRW